MRVLCFTAEEAWQHLYGIEEAEEDYTNSVFFAGRPELDDIRPDAAADALWQQCLTLRGEITRVLEIARQNKAIGLSLDAEVVLQAGPEWRQLIADTPGMLAARDRFLSAGWYLRRCPPLWLRRFL